MDVVGGAAVVTGTGVVTGGSGFGSGSGKWDWPGFFFPAMTFMQHPSKRAWQQGLPSGQAATRLVQAKKSQVQSAEMVDSIKDQLNRQSYLGYRRDTITRLEP